jgi:fatty-acyl-CoA synthase
LIELLARQFPKWMLPDDVVCIDEIPHTATGKIMKTRLREMFARRPPRPHADPADTRRNAGQ